MKGLSTQHAVVSEYYAQLRSSDDLKTDAACCTTDAPPRYVAEVMPLIADEVVEKFYGCGSPIPPALQGLTVLDLGCGTGRDVYVLSKLVGESGQVIGVDMTPSQLDIARKYQDFHTEKFGYEKSNVEFKLGYIEDLRACGIEDASIDLVVSNCVVNLSPFKEYVFREIYRVLKPGGELYFSDVYCDRRMPAELRADPIMVGECLGGALYWEDFRAMMYEAGFQGYVFNVLDDMHVGDLALETKCGFIQFTSATVRAFKMAGDGEGALESTEEDYGQVVTYKGGIPESPRYFDFSVNDRFIKNKPRAVSGNTATMLGSSRYAQYFDITPAGAHRGVFDAGQAQLALDVRLGKREVTAGLLDEMYERLDIKTFEDRVGEPELLRTHEHLSTMQVNITYACNLKCTHCYLNCSPERREAMSRETMQACLDGFTAGDFRVMDITGGSPELNENFEWFLREASKRVRGVRNNSASEQMFDTQVAGKRVGEAQIVGNKEQMFDSRNTNDLALESRNVSENDAPAPDLIVRSNLTLYDNPKYEPLLQLYADLGVHIIASVPFYTESDTDNQRGSGVFERVMRTCKKLNALGYGKDAGKKLDLVYNVAGPFLPWPQDMIEAAYKKRLQEEQGIVFDHLYAFNNYALGRFAEELLENGMLEKYLELLANNFNARAVTRMMCLDQVNVDWDGRLYDCEVNHVLKMPIQVVDADDATRDATVHDLAHGQLPTRKVRTHSVCYSCAAGFGSSCGGSLV